MEQTKLYPLRTGQLEQEVILNTPESQMITASYELEYISALKLYQVRFFIPSGSQRGRWSGVRYFVWKDGRKIEYIATHTTGCYTIWLYSGDHPDDLDLSRALYLYS